MLTPATRRERRIGILLLALVCLTGGFILGYAVGIFGVK